MMRSCFSLSLTKADSYKGVASLEILVDNNQIPIPIPIPIGMRSTAVILQPPKSSAILTGGKR